MGTMRGGGMGMGMRAERSPHGRRARAGHGGSAQNEAEPQEAGARRSGRWLRRARG